ncbi:MAG: hypothetical protein B6D35_12550 [Candidatus Brocadia sp. UTAMX2]|nr:MAG: hypothetical protein B6D35_12550 [Candidatus Brocadia sp. UTAMX2]
MPEIASSLRMVGTWMLVITILRRQERSFPLWRDKRSKAERSLPVTALNNRIKPCAAMDWPDF